MADRSPAAQFPDQRHRQHPSRRVLHRQALLADGPTGRLGLLDARPSRYRARAHRPGPAAADARTGRRSGPRRTGAKLARWGTELHDRFMFSHSSGPTRRHHRHSSTPPALRSSSPSSRRIHDFAAFSRFAISARRASSCEIRMARGRRHVLGQRAPRHHITTSFDGRDGSSYTSAPGRRSSCDHLRRRRVRCNHDGSGRQRSHSTLSRLAAPTIMRPTIARTYRSSLRPRRHLDEPLAQPLRVPRRHPRHRLFVTFPVERLQAEAPAPRALLPGRHAPGDTHFMPNRPTSTFRTPSILRRAPPARVRPARLSAAARSTAAAAPRPEEYVSTAVLAAPRPPRHTRTRSCARWPRGRERGCADTLSSPTPGPRARHHLRRLRRARGREHRPVGDCIQFPWCSRPTVGRRSPPASASPAGLRPTSSARSLRARTLAEERRDPPAGHLRPSRLLLARRRARPASGRPPCWVRRRPGALARRRWWVVDDRPPAPSRSAARSESAVVSRVFPADVRRSVQAPGVVLRRLAHLARPLGAARRQGRRGTPFAPGPYVRDLFGAPAVALVGFALVEGSDSDGARHDHVSLRRSTASSTSMRSFVTRTMILRIHSGSAPIPALSVPGLTDLRAARLRPCSPMRSAGRAQSGALLGSLPGSATSCRRALAAAVDRDLVAGRAGGVRDAWRRPERLIVEPIERFAERTRGVIGKLSLEEREALRKHIAASSTTSRSGFTSRRRRCSRNDARLAGRAHRQAAHVRGRDAERLAAVPGSLTRASPRRDLARHRHAARRPFEGHSGLSPTVRSDAEFSLLSTTVTVADLISADATLPSRAAENLFWFGRYGERCDATARVLRVALGAVLGDSGTHVGTPRRGRSPSGSASSERAAARRARCGVPRPAAKARSASASRACRASPSRCATGCRSTTGAPSTA